MVTSTYIEQHQSHNLFLLFGGNIKKNFLSGSQSNTQQECTVCFAKFSFKHAKQSNYRENVLFLATKSCDEMGGNINIDVTKESPVASIQGYNRYLQYKCTMLQYTSSIRKNSQRKNSSFLLLYLCAGLSWHTSLITCRCRQAHPVWQIGAVCITIYFKLQSTNIADAVK